MSPRSLPERTVDAWVSAVVCSRFPGALVWAPTQSAFHGNWDFGMDLGDGKVFILEDKATEHEPRTKLPDTHRISIDMNQLDWYCDDVEPNKGVPVHYVLPKPPWTLPPVGSVVPPHSVTRVTSAAGPFEEWAFVMRCTQLRKELRGQASLLVDRLPMPNSEPLDDFLGRVESCEIGRRVQGTGDLAKAMAGGDQAEPSEDLSPTGEPRTLEEADRAGSALGFFVPSRVLPDF